MNSLTNRFLQSLKPKPKKSPKAYFVNESGESKYPYQMTLEDDDLLEKANNLPMSSEMPPVPHFDIKSEREKGNKDIEARNNRDMSDEDYRVAGRKLRRTRKRVIGRRKTKRLAPKRRKAAKRKTARK